MRREEPLQSMQSLCGKKSVQSVRGKEKPLRGQLALSKSNKMDR